jgi:hypothetical protein
VKNGVPILLALSCYVDAIKKYILWYDCVRKWLDELSELNACLL